MLLLANCFLHKGEELSSNPQHPVVVPCTCIISADEAEGRGFLELPAQLVLPISEHWVHCWILTPPKIKWSAKE